MCPFSLYLVTETFLKEMPGCGMMAAAGKGRHRAPGVCSSGEWSALALLIPQPGTRGNAGERGERAVPHSWDLR